MCNINVKNECKKCGHDSDFSNQEDLIKYKKYLEQELEIVNKTLQDIKEAEETP